MATYLALLREAMDLLESCTSDATLENAVVLFCIHVERLVVDRWVGLKTMGGWGWVLGKGGLGFATHWGGRAGRGRGWMVVCRGRGTIIEVVEVGRCRAEVVSWSGGEDGGRLGTGHTMELAVRVGKRLVLRGDRIRGMK